ncbi:hypothetical protein MIR68_004958 [Amoeboaphelidium protococcarum]|nr:hypothetical protein MIR68_004958 [Amoeboaphelidium protococcarum]
MDIPGYIYDPVKNRYFKQDASTKSPRKKLKQPEQSDTYIQNSAADDEQKQDLLDLKAYSLTRQLQSRKVYGRLVNINPVHMIEYFAIKEAIQEYVGNSWIDKPEPEQCLCINENIYAFQHVRSPRTMQLISEDVNVRETPLSDQLIMSHITDAIDITQRSKQSYITVQRATRFYAIMRFLTDRQLFNIRNKFCEFWWERSINPMNFLVYIPNIDSVLLLMDQNSSLINLQTKFKTRVGLGLSRGQEVSAVATIKHQNVLYASNTGDLYCLTFTSLSNQYSRSHIGRVNVGGRNACIDSIVPFGDGSWVLLQFKFCQQLQIYHLDGLKEQYGSEQKISQGIITARYIINLNLDVDGYDIFDNDIQIQSVELDPDECILLVLFKCNDAHQSRLHFFDFVDISYQLQSLYYASSLKEPAVVVPYATVITEDESFCLNNAMFGIKEFYRGTADLYLVINGSRCFRLCTYDRSRRICLPSQ